MKTSIFQAASFVSIALLIAGCASVGGERSGLITTDHYVHVKSTAPSITGQSAQI